MSSADIQKSAADINFWNTSLLLSEVTEMTQFCTSLL